jgi:hypothetical protein
MDRHTKLIAFFALVLFAFVGCAVIHVSFCDETKASCPN